MRYGDREIRHTQIADEMIDHWMPHLTGGEWKVLCYLARKIFGWHKRDDTVSIRQFCEGESTKEGTVIDEGTGLKERQVQQVLAILVDAGIVVKAERVAPTGKTLACAFRLNLDVDWPAARSFLEENRRRYYGNGSKSLQRMGAVDCTHDCTSSMGAVHCGERVQSTAPVGVQSTAPMLATGGVQSTTPTTNKDIYKSDNNNNNADSARFETGAKGGEVPSKTVAAGGKPPDPLINSSCLPGVNPQTPEQPEEGAAAPRVERSIPDLPGVEILGEDQRRRLKAAGEQLTDKDFISLCEMTIDICAKQIKEAKATPPAPRPQSPPLAPPVKTPQKPTQSKSSGFTPLGGALHCSGSEEAAYRAFHAVASREGVLRELQEWGVTEKKARDICARASPEQVMAWMEKAATKANPAAYVVSLADVSAKVGGKR